MRRISSKRAAAASADEIERVAEAEGDPLQHRARDLGLGGARGEADERAARQSVVVGRALAHEVREEDEAARARARGARGVGDDLVGVGAPDLGGHLLAVAEDVAVPAQRPAGGEHHAHRVVRARHGVAEGVEAHLGLDGVAGGVRQHDAARAQRGHGAPRAHHAEAHRARGVVGGAARHGDARRAGRSGSPSTPRAGRGSTVDSPAGGQKEAGTSSAPSTSSLQRRAPGSKASVPLASLTSAPISPVSSQPAQSLGMSTLLDERVGLGLVGAQPEELGQGEPRERAVADGAPQAVVAERRADGLALGGGARVAPEHGRTHRLLGHVEEHRGVHLPGEADGAHRARARAERGGELPQGQPEGALVSRPGPARPSRGAAWRAGTRASADASVRPLSSSTARALRPLVPTSTPTSRPIALTTTIWSFIPAVPCFIISSPRGSSSMGMRLVEELGPP